MRRGEDQLQIACMNYLRYQYPDTLAFHVPNGGSRSKAEGGRFKAMGVLAGVPDILVASPLYDTAGSILYCGLAIEMKDGEKGRVSRSQQQVMDRFSNARWMVRVCRTFDQFQQVVDEYLKP